MQWTADLTRLQDCYRCSSGQNHQNVVATPMQVMFLIHIYLLRYPDLVFKSLFQRCTPCPIMMLSQPSQTSCPLTSLSHHLHPPQMLSPTSPSTFLTHQPAHQTRHMLLLSPLARWHICLNLTLLISHRCSSSLAQHTRVNQ